MARKILLADDSVTAQNMGRKILTDAGYEVITVNNGSAALKKIAESKPDLIVLDVYMPGYSGLEVCQRLKETQETSRIPVLLTVGKLEPFKPEEAKRVRAEAYIVKPFEASELLSTLTKLEDKIVPRPEAAKPGRFARANAALDEGRYDKTVANEEDSGWKNRIAFPSRKKKEKAVEQEDGDDPAIYNAVNRDLRTTLERHPDHAPQEAKAHHDKPEEGRVDLGALAPEGLPKDVTPEEIAALAAAAAQVKGKFGESFETKVGEPVSENPPAVVAEANAGEKTDVRTEAKSESQPEALSSTEPPKEVAPPEAALATLAEQRLEEKKEEKVDAPAETHAAAASFEPAFSVTDSGNGSGSPSFEQRPADELVTMAVATGAESAPAVPRWTAFAVALAPEESAISLELEMEKAHAAFAAAEAAQTGSVVIIPEPPRTSEPAAAVEPSTVESSSSAAAQGDSVAPMPAIPVSESAQAASSETTIAETTSASSAPETSTPKVKDFESVSAFWAAPQSPAPAFSEPVPTQTEPPAPVAPEAAHEPEAPAQEIPVAEISPSQPEIAREAAQEIALEAPRREPIEEQKEEEKEEEKEETKEEAKEETRREEPAPPEPVVAASAETAPAPNTASASSSEGPEAALTSQEAAPPADATPVSDARASSLPAEPVPTEATERVAKKEPDFAATTAAAWASWRRIRESGDSSSSPAKPPQNENHARTKDEAPLQREDVAAMAVAAGAEQTPQEAPGSQDSDSPEIASIVDSVLADLRPKIVAEISRKLGKKKK